MTVKKDSILVDIFIGDAKTKEPLIYSNVFFKDSKDKTLKYLETDNNGRCTIKFLKSNEILMFYAYYIGYRRFNCTIQLNCSSKLTVYMKQEYGEYSTGDTLIFKIKRKKKKTILLKGDKDYSVYEKYYRKQNYLLTAPY